MSTYSKTCTLETFFKDTYLVPTSKFVQHILNEKMPTYCKICFKNQQENFLPMQYMPQQLMNENEKKPTLFTIKEKSIDHVINLA